MSDNKTSSRRSFLKGGALLAAPLSVSSVGAAAFVDDSLKARVTQLEDEAALRELHRAWLRKLNGGEGMAGFDRSIRRIDSHPAAADQIRIGSAGDTAVGHFEHAVARERPLPLDTTLAKMAHAQGHGAVLHTERQVLSFSYAKRRGVWTITSVELEAPI